MAGRHKGDVFTRFTSRVAATMGRAWIFAAAVSVLIIWGLSGPVLGFSDTWQLIINTSTTIITFLMVFIIQNTQNRDNMAINVKLDALLKKHGMDTQKILAVEEESDKKLQKDVKKMQKPDKT